MAKQITCWGCGGLGLEELFGEMPGAMGTCTTCGGSGKMSAQEFEPLTYETYIKEAKARGAAMKAPGSLIFPRNMPPIAKVADNGIDVVIDEAATRDRYWGEDTKTAADCALRFDNLGANFSGRAGHSWRFLDSRARRG